MKYSYKTIALFLGLGLVAASCQKENVVVESVSAEENQSYINARYTVDGVSMQISFSDEGSWQAFLHWSVCRGSRTYPDRRHNWQRFPI